MPRRVPRRGGVGRWVCSVVSGWCRRWGCARWARSWARARARGRSRAGGTEATIEAILALAQRWCTSGGGGGNRAGYVPGQGRGARVPKSEVEVRVRTAAAGRLLRGTAAEEKAKCLSVEVEQLTVLAGDLARRLELSEGTKNVLRVELDRANGLGQTLQAALDTERARVARLQAETTRHEVELKDIERYRDATIAATNERAVVFERRARSADVTSSALASDVLDMQDAMATLATSLASQKKARAAADSRVAELEAELASERCQRELHCKHITILTQEKERLQAKLDKLTAAVVAQREVLDSMLPSEPVSKLAVHSFYDGEQGQASHDATHPLAHEAARVSREPSPTTSPPQPAAVPPTPPSNSAASSAFAPGSAASDFVPATPTSERDLSELADSLVDHIERSVVRSARASRGGGEPGVARVAAAALGSAHSPACTNTSYDNQHVYTSYLRLACGALTTRLATS